MKEAFAELVKNLAALVKVKTVVTFAVVAVFCVLALRETLQPDVVMAVVSTVIAFYFGTQSEKGAAGTGTEEHGKEKAPGMTARRGKPDRRTRKGERDEQAEQNGAVYGCVRNGFEK